MNIKAEQIFIENSTLMEEPNSPIKIYEGNFYLKNNTVSEEFKGEIEYRWFPSPNLTFFGKSNRDDFFMNVDPDSHLFIGEDKIGKVSINSMSIGSEFRIKGIIKKAIVGDKSIPVDKILFSLPNMRNFESELTATQINEGRLDKYKFTPRILLEDDKFIVKIDQRFEYKKKGNALSDNGGYLILCNGCITIKDNSTLTHDKISDLLLRLSYFLSFVNGRRCTPIFLKGYFEEEVIWSDYTNYISAPYKYASSWMPTMSKISLNPLWKSFTKLWKNDENDKDFLITSIHWYLEANSNKTIIEGAIVMAQTSFELLYNWLVIEKNKIIIGKDSEGLSASNKIRLLLSQAKIENKIPPTLTKLSALINEKEFLSDGPHAIVYLRNAIVHSQLEKRKSIKSIDILVKEEALRLSIMYIELTMLSILNYNGKYFNRCAYFGSTEEKEPIVPWNK